MAFTFQSKPVATIKARSGAENSTDYISMPGCNATDNSGDNAAAQINKLLTIGGMSVVADATMKRTVTEEVVSNG